VAAVRSSFSTTQNNVFARSSLFRAQSLSELPFKPTILKIQAAGRKEDALMLADDFQGFF
jgi:hypothetical protein